MSQRAVRSFVVLLTLSLLQRLGAQASTADWHATALPTGDYAARLDTVHQGGERSVALQGIPSRPYGIATFTKSVPAAELRGHRVRLSGALRTSDVRGVGAYLVLNAFGASPVPIQGATDDSAVVGTTGWTQRTVEWNVPEGARLIEVGFALNGHGTAWLDDLKLVPVGDSAKPIFEGFEGVTVRPLPIASALEGPRELSPRGTENLAAFATVFGLARHFYPSDAGRTANWDDIAVEGVRAAEGAPTTDSLRRVLERLLHEVAPQLVLSTKRMAAPASPPRAHSVTWWRNEGLELPGPLTQGNIYRSDLVTSPITAGKQAGPAMRVWAGAIGAGLFAAVPLAIYQPDSIPTETSARIAPEPAREVTSPNDRASRIAGVIVAWNAVRHGWPYFDEMPNDWNGALRPALRKAARDSSAADYYGTLLDLMGKLPDGHGNVILQAAPYRFGFLPFSVDWIENALVMTNAAPDAPPPIAKGARILAVDGVPVDSVLRMREKRLPGATAGFRRYRGGLDLVLGPRDSAVVVRVAGANGEAPVDIPLSYRWRTRTSEPLSAPLRDAAPGIRYVDLSRISEAQLKAALPDLLAAKGVIVDIRSHPRANTMELLSHLSRDTLRSDFFEHPMLREPNGGRIDFVDHPWVIAPQEPVASGKFVFLVGPGAVSSAESTLGIVEHYHLGALVGSASAGTNGNVNQFWVPGRVQVVFTGMRVRKRSGAQHHGIGVAPTIPVARTARGVVAGRDEVLERAVELLQTGR